MATIEQCVPPLALGDRLSRDEFIRRWEMHPEIKRAELLGGIVYVSSPLSAEHGTADLDFAIWLGHYKLATRGTTGASDATTYLLQDVPQPDFNLRILPECGGRSYLKGRYIAGIPELLAEISLSSVAYDLHQKLDLYREAGVPEYIVVILYEKEIRWHVLEDGEYRLLTPDPDGVLRSRIFPGLWLDGPAFLAGDMEKVMAKLNEGLKSPEHQAFVEKLARSR